MFGKPEDCKINKLFKTFSVNDKQTESWSQDNTGGHLVGETLLKLEKLLCTGNHSLEFGPICHLAFVSISLSSGAVSLPFWVCEAGGICDTHHLQMIGILNFGSVSKHFHIFTSVLSQYLDMIFLSVTGWKEQGCPEKRPYYAGKRMGLE